MDPFLYQLERIRINAVSSPLDKSNPSLYWWGALLNGEYGLKYTAN
jgi:hypothetical protein